MKRWFRRITTHFKVVLRYLDDVHHEVGDFWLTHYRLVHPYHPTIVSPANAFRNTYPIVHTRTHNIILTTMDSCRM